MYMNVFHQQSLPHRAKGSLSSSSPGWWFCLGKRPLGVAGKDAWTKNGGEFTIVQSNSKFSRPKTSRNQKNMGGILKATQLDPPLPQLYRSKQVWKDSGFSFLGISVGDHWDTSTNLYPRNPWNFQTWPDFHQKNRWCWGKAAGQFPLGALYIAWWCLVTFFSDEWTILITNCRQNFLFVDCPVFNSKT